MRIEQYFLMIDYSLWEVILNGDSPVPTRVIEDVVQPVAPTTAEQRLARKNELKAHGTLLMALPDKHQLKFNIHKDAKTLIDTIEKRFGGNKETKKVHKILFKQQYESFTGSSSESLDQIHDRLQKLISQLEIIGESLSQEDINLKFLRSLPIEWRTHTLIWRNKTDLEDQSLDDFTNKPVSDVASVSAASAKIHVFALPNQIDVDDLEKMDLKWQMAMLTVRARRFLQMTVRNLGANGPTSMGFDMSKVECYNCHKDALQESACHLRTQRGIVGSYDWSFQAEEEPTNYALMAFTSSSSSSSDNEAASCSKACTKAYDTLQLLVYQQNETVFEEDIKLLKLDVQLRDNTLVVLRQKFKKAEQERDELQLKLEKFQTSSKNLSQLLASQTNDKTELGNNNQVFTSSMFSDEMFSSEIDESLPATPTYDRYQSGVGYHAISSPYTGTFMPPKPNLVFHDAPHVSDSKDDSEAELLQNDLSFVQPTEQVKTHRPFVKPVETFIPAATHKTTFPKPKPHGNSSNRKACFVCKSLTHLIKDYEYYEKKIAQTSTGNHAERENNQHYARMSLPNPQKHVVPTAVLTKSKLVPLTAISQVTTAVPQPLVTRPRPVQTVVTKTLSPPRRTINRRPSPPASYFSPKVTAAKAPKINAIKGVQGNWIWKPKCPILYHVSHHTSASMTLKSPQHALKDKGVIDSGCSRHMTGNMSYLSDFEEINGGYVAFGGNPKGGKITGKGKIRTRKLDFDDVYIVKELKFNLFSVSQMYDKKNSVLFTDTECIVLSREFKSSDENQVLFRVLRENNMFSWVFFLATKDETSPILKTFITGIENQLSLKVKIIRSDNGTEFKNHNLNQFCGIKGIKRELNVARTPQQNGIAKRKNKTLIEAARTMLADSLLPIPFWTEAVNNACYVKNKVLVTKLHNKTPYELLHGKTPSIGFMRPFGCPVTILNILDPLAKFNGKVDKGFLVGYSVSSKAFNVFNSRTRIIQETLYINFLENKPNVAGSGPTWLFDINTLTKTMNYQPIIVGNQSNLSAGVQEQFDAEKAGEENVQQYMLFSSWSSGYKNPLNTDDDAAFEVKKPESNVHVSPSSSAKTQKHDDKTKREAKGKSPVELSIGVRKLIEVEDFTDNSTNEVNAASTPVLAVGQNSTNSTNTFSAAGPSNTAEELLQFKMQKVWVLVDLPNEKRAIGTKWVFRNKKDERDIVVRNKARLVAQGHTQEEGIDYKEVFALVARIEAIRLFLAYASFIGFMVYQMDVKSAFLYGTIEEEVYVCQPPGFKDPDYPDKVYKVVKALYGLHQAPRAKKVIITKATVQEALHRDDAESIDCLPNEEIFIELARMGYEKPSTKLTFYKAFFSSQWKFLIHTILQCMSAKRTSWNEFSSSIASVVICLSTGRKFNFSKYIFDSLVRNVDSSSKFYMYPRFLQLMIRAQVSYLSSYTTKYSSPTLTQKVFANMRKVRKGFSGVETPLFEGMILAQQANEGAVGVVDKDDAGVDVDDVPVAVIPTLPPSPIAQPSSPSQQQQPSQPTPDAEISLDLLHTLLETCTNLKKRLERRNKLKMSKLRGLKKVRTAQRVDTSDDTVMDDVSKQGEIKANMDADEDVTLKDVAAVEKDDEVKKDANVQGRPAESQTQIYQIDLEHAEKVLSMQDDEPEPTELKEVVEVVTTAKLITEVVTAAAATITDVATTAPTITTTPSATRNRKGVVKRDPEETDTPSIIIHSEPKSKDKGKGIMDQESKPLKKQAQIEQDEAYSREYQALKRKPQTQAQAKKNMMIYLRNMARFKMDYFKGMSYDDIRPIFEKYFNSNVAFLEKTKEQMEEEDSRALKRKVESSEEKAAKKQKLDEAVEELRKHLQIMPNDDDDVYTEATPLALKFSGSTFLLSYSAKLTVISNPFPPDHPYGFALDLHAPIEIHYVGEERKAIFGDPELELEITVLFYFLFNNFEIVVKIINAHSVKICFVSPENHIMITGPGIVEVDVPSAFAVVRDSRSNSLSEKRVLLFTRDNNCTIEFDAFGFSVKDYLTHHILLRCDSSGDLYPVTKPSTPHIAFLSTSASTWHQRLGHPGDQDLWFSGCLLIYVDDIILTASCPALLQQIIGYLNNEFDMTDLGALNYFLGIFADRTPTGLFLSQKNYALQLLERAHMATCNPSRTPVDTESKLAPKVQQICLYMHDPREPHLAALKRILRYVQGTLNLGLHLYASSTTSLVGYTDADWASCPSTRSAKAEYRGVANVVAETAWLRNLLRELHSPLSTAILVYCDNVGAVYMSVNPVQHQRTKHIEIDIHFVRDMVTAGQVIRALRRQSSPFFSDDFYWLAVPVTTPVPDDPLV
nr:putative ribonuclease H-like domain-containing protein [Tanacetum cinerariifolium]